MRRVLALCVFALGLVGCDSGPTDPFQGDLSLKVEVATATPGSLVVVEFRNDTNEPFYPTFPCGGSFERYDGSKWVSAGSPLIICGAVVFPTIPARSSQSVQYYLPEGVPSGRYRAVGTFASLSSSAAYERVSNEIQVLTFGLQALR